MKIICYNTHRAHGRKHSKTLRNNYSSDINLENDSDRVIYLAPLYILCTRKLLKGRQELLSTDDRFRDRGHLQGADIIVGGAFRR